MKENLNFKMSESLLSIVFEKICILYLIKIKEDIKPGILILEF